MLSDLEYLGLQVDLDNDAAQVERSHNGGKAMTKKHFEQVAMSFKRKLDPMYYPQSGVRTAVLRDIAADLCNTFSQVNPNFSSRKFLSACGFKE